MQSSDLRFFILNKGHHKWFGVENIKNVLELFLEECNITSNNCCHVEKLKMVFFIRLFNVLFEQVS